MFVVHQKQAITRYEEWMPTLIKFSRENGISMGIWHSKLNVLAL